MQILSNCFASITVDPADVYFGMRLSVRENCFISRFSFAKIRFPQIYATSKCIWSIKLMFFVLLDGITFSEVNGTSIQLILQYIGEQLHIYLKPSSTTFIHLISINITFFKGTFANMATIMWTLYTSKVIFEPYPSTNQLFFFIITVSN